MESAAAILLETPEEGVGRHVCVWVRVLCLGGCEGDPRRVGAGPRLVNGLWVWGIISGSDPCCWLSSPRHAGRPSGRWACFPGLVHPVEGGELASVACQ